MSAAPPEVRAVTVNYHGADLLPDCVESLRAQRGVRVEVIVVDSGSRDDSEAVARRLGVEYRGLRRNHGLGVGYNEGAWGARSPYLFFVNNDMRFAPDCLATMLDHFRGREDLFALDPRHYSWGGERVSHGALGLRADERSAFVGLPGVEPYEREDVEEPTEIPWGCAGALLVERAKFEALGGFDSTFFLYAEDVDLCLRAWRRGWPTVHVPRAVLFHHVSASHGPKGWRRTPLWRRGEFLVNYFRIKISVPKNAQRVALKMLPPRELARHARQVLGSWGRAIAAGRVTLPIVALAALGANLVEAPRWLPARRREQREARVGVEELLARFTGG